jgi:hypothetical protein
VSLLSCSSAPQLSRYVPVVAGFLCEELSIFSPSWRTTPCPLSRIISAVHSELYGALPSTASTRHVTCSSDTTHVDWHYQYAKLQASSLNLRGNKAYCHFRLHLHAHKSDAPQDAEQGGGLLLRTTSSFRRSPSFISPQAAAIPVKRMALRDLRPIPLLLPEVYHILRNQCKGALQGWPAFKCQVYSL